MFGVPRWLFDAAVAATGWAGADRTMAEALSEVRTRDVPDEEIHRRLQALGDRAVGVKAFALKRLLLLPPGSASGSQEPDGPRLVHCAECARSGPPAGFDARCPATHGPGTANEFESILEPLCLPHADALAERLPPRRLSLPEARRRASTSA